MFKKVLLYFIGFLLFFSYSYSQEKVLEFSTDFEDYKKTVKESFSLVNKNNNDFAVFLSRNNDISANFFDENFNNKGRIVSTKLPSKYKRLIGKTAIKNNFILFFANNSREKFASILFNLEDKKNSSRIDILTLKKERFIESFSTNKKFYIITLSTKKSVLFLYEFDELTNYKKREYNLENYKFLDDFNKEKKLITVMRQHVSEERRPKIQKIENDLPYSLEETSNPHKIYTDNNFLNITLDNNNTVTQIITIDLNSNNIRVKSIPKTDLGLVEMRTNSFLFENKLFQYLVSPKELDFKITNIENNTIIKHINVLKKDSISFANSKILQRNDDYSSFKEITKTKKFLRKMMSGKIGLLVTKSNTNNYQVTFGGTNQSTYNLIKGISVFTSAFIPAIPIAQGASVYVNPLGSSLFFISKSKAVYFNSSFNKEFEHINEKKLKPILTALFEYFNENEKLVKKQIAPAFFKYRNDYFYGSLNKKEKKYSILKFSPENEMQN